MAESRRFFSRLINGLASYVQCEGGLINDGKLILFLGMIDGSNTALLLPVVGGMIDSRDTVLLLLAGRRFGCLQVTANQRAQAD
jgi:hypothetical protein